MPVSPELDGHHFFTKVNMKRAATPLLAALVVVEFTDVIFAVDSVPAVLAVSHEPYLVFASNAFAILGLRAAYFLLAGWKDRLHYLGHGLGLILVFVGVEDGGVALGALPDADLARRHRGAAHRRGRGLPHTRAPARRI